MDIIRMRIQNRVRFNFDDMVSSFGRQLVLARIWQLLD
jgi:hypothetical protein